MTNFTLENFSAPSCVTVMGLGLFGGGVGAAKFFARRGSKVVVTDLRDADTLQPSISALIDLPIVYHLGEHRDEDFIDTDLLIVNPAVPFDHKMVATAQSNGVPIATEIGIALALNRGLKIAVTGANGKSTTTALAGEMLRAHDRSALLGGNIGGSLLDLAIASPESSDRFLSAPLAVELSSFQLHYLQFCEPPFAPRAAIITNLSPNHLDWHKTLAHYYDSKRRLLRHQTAADFAVLNFDDPILRQWADACEATVIASAIDERTVENEKNCGFIRDEKIVLRLDAQADRVIGDLRNLQIPGEHNRSNCLQAALATAAVIGADVGGEAVADGIKNFVGLPHRLQKVAEIFGRSFIDDSIATTPESAVCGIKAFSTPIVIIAGGYDKGVDLSAMAIAIADSATAAVLIGKTAKKIADAIRTHRTNFPIYECGTDFQTAVKTAFAHCPDGGVILLSPGCASYDMFKNFAERGDQFKQIAEELKIKN